MTSREAFNLVWKSAQLSKKNQENAELIEASKILKYSVLVADAIRHFMNVKEVPDNINKAYITFNDFNVGIIDIADIGNENKRTKINDVLMEFIYAWILYTEEGKQDDIIR